jgi:hypothetical protein
MRSGPAPGKVFELRQDEMIIGREVSVDIVINDAEVSRKHARLVPQHGGFIIEDLGSTNGTFVNGQRLMGPHMLRSGELISIGENVSLAFEASQYDQGATMVSGSAGYTPTVQAPSPGVYQPVEPAYSGQVPPGPADDYSPPDLDFYQPDYDEEKKSSNTWLYVGIGLAVVLICICVAGVTAFDLLDLYCEAPFDQIFNCP